MIVGRIKRQETPGGYQAPEIPHHDVRPDGRRARGIGDHVRGDLRVAEGPKGEGAAGDEEDGAVADVRVRGG